MINKINCCTNRRIIDSFQNIEEIVNFIKSPPPEHIRLVEQARSLDKNQRNMVRLKEIVCQLSQLDLVFPMVISMV